MSEQLPSNQLLCRAAGWLDAPDGESKSATIFLISGMKAEIERLERDLRRSHAAYNAMLDKAAELERKLQRFPVESSCEHSLIPVPGAAVRTRVCSKCKATIYLAPEKADGGDSHG